MFFSFGARRPAESLATQRLIADMGLVVKSVTPGFNSYVGAGILAGTSHQVEDDAARALRLELLDRRRDVVRRVLIERLQRDVADLVAQRERVRNRRDVDFARVKFALIGAGTPGREKVTLTLVPMMPVSESDTLVDRPTLRRQRSDFA